MLGCQKCNLSTINVRTVHTYKNEKFESNFVHCRHFDYEPVQKEFENLFKSLEPQVEQRPLPVLVHMLNLQRKVQFCNHDLIAKILDK